MTAYGILKTVHIACVAASISLFVYRYSLRVRYTDRPLPEYLKLLPHIVDTVLLAAALGMLAVAGLNPFAVVWLQAKMLALVAYIALGAMCLRAMAGSRRQGIFFILALAAFAYILVTAYTKKALPI